MLLLAQKYFQVEIYQEKICPKMVKMKNLRVKRLPSKLIKKKSLSTRPASNDALPEKNNQKSKN